MRIAAASPVALLQRSADRVEERTPLLRRSFVRIGDRGGGRPKAGGGSARIELGEGAAATTSPCPATDRRAGGSDAAGRSVDSVAMHPSGGSVLLAGLVGGDECVDKRLDLDLGSGVGLPADIAADPAHRRSPERTPG